MRVRQTVPVPLHFAEQAELWPGADGSVQSVFDRPSAAGTR
jgi:hypothetical protein